jgi:integrase
MTLPKYLQKRRQGFYAVLEIPKALRQIFENKVRFIQSLETREQRVAEKRLPIVIARWKDQLEQAKGTYDPAKGILWEVMEWRKAIETAPDDTSKEMAESLAYDWVEKLAAKEGVPAAQEAVGVIFHNVQPLTSNFDDWTETIKHLNPKTQALQKNAVKDLCENFQTTAEIDKNSVKTYLSMLRTEKELSDKTISLRLTFIRSFVNYMDDKYGTTLLPLFTVKNLARTSTAKTVKQRAWIPFAAEEVSRLHQAALDKKDQPLADLIACAAYTGCRIEELGQIKTEHVSEQGLRIVDSKTAAGIREVPLHPALKPLMDRLRASSKDGFIIPGTDEGSFGKRSAALGKRFGHLKTKLGFGEQHVFHSIRKTVVSQLEQAGVNENTTADIVGHDKPRITYGLYSSGASLKQKAEALSQVAYGGSLKTPT